ncbi:hypothetical protein Tco_0896741 [Tanacetum coccineum]
MRKTKLKHNHNNTTSQHITNINSSHSFTEDEMTNLGYYNFTSSSSSNLSPLAQPFTVDRSNPNKSPNPSPNPNPNPGFNAPLDALNYGSNWVPSYPSPTPDSTRTNTVSYDGFGNNDEKSTRNWSSMNSSVKSGLEGVAQFGGGNLYGNVKVKPTTSWPFHDGDSDENGAPLVPLGFDMLSGDFGSSQSLFEAKYGGKVDGSRGKEGSPMFGRVVGDRVVRENNVGPLVIGKSHDAYPATNHKENGIAWNGPTVPFETRPLVWSSSGDIKSPLINDGSRGKQDSAMPLGFLGDYVARENNIGPSIIRKSNGAFPAANNGLVSHSLSNEHSTTWNGNASYYETRPFFDDSSSALKSISIQKPSPSIVIKPSVTVSSSISAQGAVSTKSMDVSSMSLFNSNNVLDGNKPLKEQESGHPVGFEFKATSSGNNNTEDVKSASNLSEHLDHHQAEEDSPCWKGASTHFSLFGSLQAESSQHPIKKVQENDSVNLQSDGGNQSMHISIEDAAKSVTAESLDVNHALKVLSSFSELLLSYCSEDESGLNKQDRKALDHIIGNLNVCMSEKIQQADAAQIDQEQNNDHVDKSIEQPPGDSVRDNDLPKDNNMIQTIKKVLDENLECSEDPSSDTMLYKNLWLEAEAELCVSSYRARFDRVKREMGKPKAAAQDVSDVASDIKKISTSIFSPIAHKVMHEAARTKTPDTLANNPSIPYNVDHIVNDVENSVMARFNILKRREESNPVNMAEKEPGVDVEASIDGTENSGVAKAPHLKHHSGEADDEFPPASSTVPEDIKHLLMARLNVLKRRGESDSVNFEHQVLADGSYAVASDKESQSCGLMAGPHFQHHAGKEKEMASDSVGGTSLMRNFDSGLYTTYGDAEKEVASGSVGGTNLMQNWFDPGLYSTYGASSDWEYVLKR